MFRVNFLAFTSTILVCSITHSYPRSSPLLFALLLTRLVRLCSSSATTSASTRLGGNSLGRPLLFSLFLLLLGHFLGFQPLRPPRQRRYLLGNLSDQRLFRVPASSTQHAVHIRQRVNIKPFLGSTKLHLFCRLLKIHQHSTRIVPPAFNVTWITLVGLNGMLDTHGRQCFANVLNRRFRDGIGHSDPPAMLATFLAIKICRPDGRKFLVVQTKRCTHRPDVRYIRIGAGREKNLILRGDGIQLRQGIDRGSLGTYLLDSDTSSTLLSHGYVVTTL
mmetsp:Transcript_12837/g.28414  ORF Transcript_12837/g.28414 Transcript_12837/m.28414 type:complete len:276 (-) Transcript_12837:83-910(-)